MKDEIKNINSTDCNCVTLTPGEIRKCVEEVVAVTGGSKESLIRILQEVQLKLNYLPAEALKYICELTEITPGQISEVSTFYSQFRHLPVGQHTIKICAGTACYVKGSPLISDAFRRELKIGAESSTSDDMLFSIEEVACLGCCTLAPVVQIDGKTYGHVKPTEAEEIIKDFLSKKDSTEKKSAETTDDESSAEIRVGLGSCCVAGGSRDVLERVTGIKDAYNLNVRIKPVGCVGVCNQTPLLEIVTPGKKAVRYTNVKKENVEDIVLKHLVPGNLKSRLRHYINDLADSFISDDLVVSPVNLPGEVREKYIDNFLRMQVHMATVHSGIITPSSYDEYCMTGGFNALKSILLSGSKSEIVDKIKQSGLRGRGGAGFPTGKKWELSSAAPGPEKYVVCNGDEGDPGAFMDRMLLESFPFRIIEGMMIAGYATGSNKGIFYIRAEYPLAVSRIREALTVCEAKGIVGNNIFGSEFTFNIDVFEGAGAFVCGEETALIASLEGKRGTPHIRPPYPVEKGFNGKPTLVNNVETLALVPWIINNGHDKFTLTGTEKSRGTKVFALAGKVARGGLIEVPMGITIRQIVEDIGGGAANGKKFKAVQIGGPSGGCIPESLADTQVDFEKLSELGAMMGSGGLVVLDEQDCMVDMAKYFLTFTHKQSCGKCTFCRVGTKHMLNILTKLTEGKGTLKDIDDLEKLAADVAAGSLCGLGKTAPNPVLTGLKYFRSEYEAHTKGICIAKKCHPLVEYRITDKCTGCTKCQQECPVNAIPFTPYEKHSIIQDLCTKCDNCRIVCQDNAVEIVNRINEN